LGDDGIVVEATDRVEVLQNEVCKAFVRFELLKGFEPMCHMEVKLLQIEDVVAWVSG